MSSRTETGPGLRSTPIKTAGSRSEAESHRRAVAVCGWQAVMVGLKGPRQEDRGGVMGVLTQQAAPVHEERSQREGQSWVPEPDPRWCCLWMRGKLWEKLVGGWGGWARISVLEALRSRCP